MFFFFQSTQVLLNKVTELVHLSHILHSDSPPVALEVETVLKHEGIVTTEDDRLSVHYIPDIFVAS